MILIGVNNLVSINWTSIETCKFVRKAMYANVLYSCFIYRKVKAFFLYRNKSYIFPILGLVKVEFWHMYYYGDMAKGHFSLIAQQTN